MIEFVRDGRIDRAEYNSLLEVLSEAKNLLPQYAADVDRAVQLIEKLLPVPGNPGGYGQLGLHKSQPHIGHLTVHYPPYARG